MNTFSACGIIAILIIVIWLLTWHIFGDPRISLVLAATAVAGSISILASLLNWQWFFTDRKVHSIVDRLIYALLGVLLLVLGHPALVYSSVFCYEKIRSWTISIAGG